MATRRYSNAICALALGTLCACQSSPAHPPDLATYMANMQRHSHKLGLAIRAHNLDLAKFYLHELVEALEDTAANVPTHDNLQIASLIDIILKPTIPPLSRSIEEQDWSKSWNTYEAAVAACNRCHTATEHAFVRIQPAGDENPYNQSFDSSQPPKAKTQ